MITFFKSFHETNKRDITIMKHISYSRWSGAYKEIFIQFTSFFTELQKDFSGRF